MKLVTDTKGLCKLYNAMQLHVRCLEAIGVSLIGYSAMLSDILQKAMPYETLIEHHRRESLKQMFEQTLLAERASETSVASPLNYCVKFKEFFQFLRVENESRKKSGALSNY